MLTGSRTAEAAKDLTVVGEIESKTDGPNSFFYHSFVGSASRKLEPHQRGPIFPEQLLAPF